MSLTINLDHRGNLEVTLPNGSTRILETKPQAVGVLVGLLSAQQKSTNSKDFLTGGSAAPLQSVLDLWMKQDTGTLVRRFNEQGKEELTLEDLL